MRQRTTSNDIWINMSRRNIVLCLLALLVVFTLLILHDQLLDQLQFTKQPLFSVPGLFVDKENSSHSFYLFDAQLSRNTLVLQFMNQLNHTGPNNKYWRGSHFDNYIHPIRYFNRVNLFTKFENYSISEEFTTLSCSALESLRFTSIVTCPLNDEVRKNFMNGIGFHLNFLPSNIFVSISFSTRSASELFQSTRRTLNQSTRRTLPSQYTNERTVSACWGAVAQNAVPYLREIIQYHISMGVHHIYIQEYLQFETNPSLFIPILKDYIQEGKVSVFPAYARQLRSKDFFDHPDSRDERPWMAFRGEVLKIPFYNSCLWHSKNWDTYTIVVDIDEIFFYNRSISGLTSLSIAFDKIFAQYTTLCSYHFGWYDVNNMDAKSFGLPIVKRFPELSLTKSFGKAMLGKSVVMTQFSTYLNIHCHSCSLNLSETNEIRRATCKVFFPEEVFLIHFRYLFPRFDESKISKRINRNQIISDNHYGNDIGKERRKRFSFVDKKRPITTTTSEHVWFYKNLVEPELLRRCREYNICYFFNQSISSYYNRSF